MLNINKGDFIVNDKNKFNAKKVALSGMLLAMTVISLYFASFLPMKLSLYALSSFLISVIIIEFDIKAGWVFYLSSCLLSLIIPDKITLIPYVLFFGMYGIVKFYIERLRRILIEYIIKLIYFNIFVLIAVLLLKKLELIPVKFQNQPLWILIAVMEVLFILYDYVYTLFIQYYNIRIRKALKF